MKIKLDTPECLPTRAHATDAGLDLKAKESVSLLIGVIEKVDTGVSVQIPKGLVGLVFPRSSMGKKGIVLANTVGVIDSDYRGKLILMLKNTSGVQYEIQAGDRIGQLVLMPIITPNLQLWEGAEDDWIDTDRGTGGFGSTGVA